MIFLNLGCGFKKHDGFVNVDLFDICEPDVVHDLNVFPYPWDDNSIDGILMWHTLEHLDDWWGAFCECGRILKPGAKLEIRVPDESSSDALTYRDHNHIFAVNSFHGVRFEDPDFNARGYNAWAATEDYLVPLKLVDYRKVPFAQYYWMMRWPFRWLLAFCTDHMRNFIREQKFLFEKIGDEND